MIISQNLITTNHRKSGKSKDDLKLTELDVVTMQFTIFTSKFRFIIYELDICSFIAFQEKQAFQENKFP